jgi:hypothetical protein
MRQLKITRLKEWANRRFSYKILVDGKEQFEIANGQERFLTIDEGATVQAKIMWCGSRIVDISSDKVKELRVRGNKGVHILFPILSFIALNICVTINIVYPDNGLKTAVTSIIVGVMIYALCLATIWRNKFLDIELVTD